MPGLQSLLVDCTPSVSDTFVENNVNYQAKDYQNRGKPQNAIAVHITCSEATYHYSCANYYKYHSQVL